MWFLSGMGYLTAGPYRLTLAMRGMLGNPVMPWVCMQALHTPFFIFGAQASGLMLVMVSLDRLVAIRFFAFYMGLQSR